MKIIMIYSELRWFGCVNEKGTMTKKELVAALSVFPDDLPVVFASGGYYWGLKYDPSVAEMGS